MFLSNLNFIYIYNYIYYIYIINNYAKILWGQLLTLPYPTLFYKYKL